MESVINDTSNTVIIGRYDSCKCYFLSNIIMNTNISFLNILEAVEIFQDLLVTEWPNAASIVCNLYVFVDECNCAVEVIPSELTLHVRHSAMLITDAAPFSYSRPLLLPNGTSDSIKRISDPLDDQPLVQ